MDKIQFEQSADFTDEEVRKSTELPPFKASSILYVTSAVLIFFSIMITMWEMMIRTGQRPDTLIEMMEWNPFSQMGLFGAIQGLFLFWLGIMVDRRGA